VLFAKRSLATAALSYDIATALNIASAGLRIRVHACISRSEIANYSAGTVTWNGVALTKIPNETTGGSGEWCVGWELRNPTPGTGNLVITNSSNTNDGTFWVIVESGTDNSVAAVGAAFENGSTTTATPAATVVAGASAIVCGSSFTYGAATPGALVGSLIGGFEVFRYAAQAIGAVPSLGTWASANQIAAFTSVVQAAATAGFTGGATLGAVVAGGSLQSVLAGFIGGATLGAVVAGGSLGATPGTSTLGPILVNGVVQANAALDYVRIYSDAGILLYERLGGSLNGSGSTALSTNAAPPGTPVRIDWQLSTGKRRMPRVTMG
jgi:hypothetical protein